MADDRLACRRSELMSATSSDGVMSCSLAISFSDCQNAFSRLTLVYGQQSRRSVYPPLIWCDDVFGGSSASLVGADLGRPFSGRRVLGQPSLNAKVDLRSGLDATITYARKSGMVASDFIRRPQREVTRGHGGCYSPPECRSVE
jgi:hypothetical protein